MKHYTVECNNCEFNKEADTLKEAEQLRHEHEGVYENHDVWLIDNTAV